MLVGDHSRPIRHGGVARQLRRQNTECHLLSLPAPFPITEMPREGLSARIMLPTHTCVCVCPPQPYPDPEWELAEDRGFLSPVPLGSSTLLGTL